MHGEGNLLAHLVIVGYKVTYQQVSNLDYTIFFLRLHLSAIVSSLSFLEKNLNSAAAYICFNLSLNSHSLPIHNHLLYCAESFDRV